MALEKIELHNSAFFLGIISFVRGVKMVVEDEIAEGLEFCLKT